jgi:hypothetical protein
MSQKKRYKDFVSRYLARGAVGVSLGLAAVAPVASSTHAETTSSEPRTTRSFSDRLAAVRSAVSDHVNEPLVVAQITPIKPPPPAPFKNFFGKAPFQDTFKNKPAPKDKK